MARLRKNPEYKKKGAQWVAKWRKDNPARNLELRRKHRTAAAKRKGKEYNPNRRRHLKHPKDSKIMDSLAEKNARQAWSYWIQEKASDEWLDLYYEAKGLWFDTRLTEAEKYRLRYNGDVEFRIKERVRRQISKARKRDGVAELIRGAIRRSGRSPKVELLLGYSINELKQHIERQFHDGMTWDDYMNGSIHIDHIRPQSSFDLSEDEQFNDCWSLTNLRPLWAKENRKKSGKIEYLI